MGICGSKRPSSAHELTRLIFGLRGGLRGGVVHFEEAILSGRGNGIRLILVEREGNHVIERSCFHIS